MALDMQLVPGKFYMSLAGLYGFTQTFVKLKDKVGIWQDKNYFWKILL